MRLTRREFLRVSALTAAGAALSSCAPAYRWLAGQAEAVQAGGLPEIEEGSGFQALNRMTFGPRAEERQRLVETGLRGWIEEQLAPEEIDDTACALRLRPLSTLEMTANDLYDLSDQIFDNQDRQRAPGELRQATLIRQITTRRQLYERMVEFWSDHFNISVEKGDCFYLKTIDDREVIRKHALGNFGELLMASAHSPAMLVYLDNQANHKEAPNENYGRELLELHSLGVHGGYSQQDVMELARCLTGWTVKEHFWRGDFTFQPEQHDSGEKLVLGRQIAAAGQAEAESVLEQLAQHPRTAWFIAGKLARRFIGDDPPVELVMRAAAAFQASRGEIKALLRVLLLDGAGVRQPKYKRPVDFVVSAVRMLAVESDGGSGLQAWLGRMGQRGFSWPTPDGYPDRSQAWQGNLLPRWQFALALATGQIEGTAAPEPGRLFSGSPGLEEAARQLSRRLLGGSLDAPGGRQPDERQLVESLRQAGEVDGDAAHGGEEWRTLAACLLASEGFQWR